jgi:DivIVA domain-containing protein
MAPELTPTELRHARFRSAFRGLDPSEVESTLNAVAAKLEQLEAEKAELENKLTEIPGHDLDDEFETVGRDVAAILQSAREAAEAMRQRASLDSSRWRAEATEEADATLKAAAADAEALRRDAWVTGSELLEQTAKAAEKMRANAERDVLTVMGEAEREAHRLTSAARREADDLMRNATMDAEKVTADATKRRDEIIDGANRQAAAAQERTRALEQRRDELLEELENVRSTLTRLEGSLEERREALDLAAAEPSSVRVVHPPAETKKQWELGETVRVVPPDSGAKQDPEVELADEMSEQVAKMREESPSQEPEPAVEPGEAETAETKTPEVVDEPPATQGRAVEPEPPDVEPAKDANDVDALFASLRGSDEEREAVKTTAKEDTVEEEKQDEVEAIDWIQVREERLLPITNRALRGVKKAMTEVQNVALDSLRTDDDWRPDNAAIAAAVHAELTAVWSESFAAGHAVAEGMGDSKLKRPATPPSDADVGFAADLAEAVSQALTKAGDGQRERQSAASRVFRVWRTDEAERRVRDIALKAYEIGLEESRKVEAVP